MTAHPAMRLTPAEIKDLVERGYTATMLDSSKQKWLQALRSGNFHQTQNTLARRVGGITCHCCLGVAATLLAGYRTEHHAGDGRLPGTLQAFDGMKYLGNTLHVQRSSPMAIYALATEPACAEPTSNPFLGEFRAGAWNDVYSKTFAEIADLIKKHIWGLPAPQETDNGN